MSFVVNLGGEGEVPGALNQQDAVCVEPFWHVARTRESFADAVRRGLRFLLCPNDALALPDGCADAVVSNGVPIGKTGTRPTGYRARRNRPHPSPRRNMDARRRTAVPQTLTRFEQLLGPAYPNNPLVELIPDGCPPLERAFWVQQRAAEWLPELLDHYGLRRTVDDALAAHAAGEVVQLVAKWNGYDLTLLDQVIDLPPGRTRPVVIDTDALWEEMDDRWPGVWRPDNLPAAILPSGEVTVSVGSVAAALGVEPVLPQYMRKLAA